MRDEVHEKMPRTNAFVAVSALENLNRTKPWSQVSTSVPALAIYAEPLPANNEPRLRRAFSNFRYEAWTDVGHFVMLEKPDDFNKRVMLFIQEIQQSSAR